MNPLAETTSRSTVEVKEMDFRQMGSALDGVVVDHVRLWLAGFKKK